jgi:hypothetical protein
MTEAYMKKALIFILLVLFTGLAAFSGQSVNGPGIKDFVLYEHEILDASAAGTVISAVPANSLPGASPVIDSIAPIIKNVVPGSIYNIGVIPVSITGQANSDIRKGGALFFNSGMKPGI